MPKEATATKKGPGRPRAEHNERYYLRHHAEERSAWETAAATCGMTLPEWMLETLNAEAKVATHVPLVKRRAAR